MRTDSLFYRIFTTAPEIFFQLIDYPVVPGYQFQSVEVKQTAFRIDGVFVPPAEAPDSPVFFIEVQFQQDLSLYGRLFAEIFLFLRQNPTVVDWQAVILFPQRGLEPDSSGPYSTLLESPQVQILYLEDLADRQDLPVGLGVLQLVVESPENIPIRARQLVERVQQQVTAPLAAAIIELIETTLVYKFPQMSRQEVEAMLGLVDDVKQTRVYQEALQEGRQEGREEGRQEGREEGRRQEGISLIMRLLTRRVGELPEGVCNQVTQLSLPQLEQLGEALLEFSTLTDLEIWLTQQPR